jgi:hypothetical protein
LGIGKKKKSRELERETKQDKRRRKMKWEEERIDGGERGGRNAIVCCLWCETDREIVIRVAERERAAGVNTLSFLYLIGEPR